MTSSFLYILVVIILVAANGFFVASEFAIVAVRRSRIVTRLEDGDKRAVILLELIDNINSYISATQLGITMASLALGWIGEPAFATLITIALGDIIPAPLLHTMAFIAAFTLITFMHIVFGELAPKTIALDRTENVALTIALPMKLFHKIFAFPIKILDISGVMAAKLFGMAPTNENRSVYSIDELRQIIDVSQKGGALEEDEQRLLHKVFEFSDAEVREVMMPRTRIVGIDISSTKDKIIEILLENMYSRYPVYKNDIENVVGVVHGKDLLGRLVINERFKLSDIMLPPIFVPEGKKVSSLLKEMQKSRNQMAFVVDEYGGLSGLVTTEDLIEELVGEIRDEHDDLTDPGLINELNDGSIIVDGLLSLSALSSILHIKLSEELPFETVAGLLLDELGHLPQPTESIVWRGYRFICEEVSGRSILKVKIMQEVESV